MTERKQIAPYPIKVRLKCPECVKHHNAEEQFFEGDPWETLITECPFCNYIIMESEWNVIWKEPKQDIEARLPVDLSEKIDSEMYKAQKEEYFDD